VAAVPPEKREAVDAVLKLKLANQNALAKTER
jgi:hypothetical protein